MILLGIAVALGMYELVTAIRTVEARPPLVPLLAGVLAMEAAAWFRGPDGLVGALLLTVLGVTVWRLADGADGYLRDVASGNLVALYLPFLAGFAVLMAHPDDGAARIVLFILTVVCSDTGGYAVGVLIGKHPMAPTVSPKKSWEGFAGSLLAGCRGRRADDGVLLPPAVVAGSAVRRRDRGHRHPGRPRRVDDQARPGDQGHGQAAARPRRHHGPAGLAAAVRAGGLPAAGRLPARLSRDRRQSQPIGPLDVAHRSHRPWENEGLMTTLPLVFDAPRKGMPPRHLADLSPQQRRDAVVQLGEQPFRADQLSRHYFARLAHDPATMTDLPAAVRDRLGEALLPPLLTEVRHVETDRGATRKTLWRLHDGTLVESVLMRYRDRVTVCISSQAGCGMACPFCATGQGGLTRNLSTAEIVEQAVAAARIAAAGELPGGPVRLSNVVFMGMGEPLANYQRVVAALHRLIDPAPAGLGLSQRSVTMSTVGLAPAIGKLADEGLNVTLAVSLHAPDDELRDTLVPVNTRWKVREVLEAADGYAARTGRRYSIEYAMIRDVNDQPWRADLLGTLLSGRLAHVNLIPLNPTPGSAWDASPKPVEEEFVARLDKPRRAGDGPRHPRPGDRRRLRPAGRVRLTASARVRQTRAFRLPGGYGASYGRREHARARAGAARYDPLRGQGVPDADPAGELRRVRACQRGGHSAAAHL